MYTLQKIINNRLANLNIYLKEETSKTVIAYLVPDYDYRVDSIVSTIDDLGCFINQHTLFQKPIIELHFPNCLAGRLLDEITSKMTNTTRKTFSKLRIIDAYRLFEYDGWNWELASTIVHH